MDNNLHYQDNYPDNNLRYQDNCLDLHYQDNNHLYLVSLLLEWVVLLHQCQDNIDRNSLLCLHNLV